MARKGEEEREEEGKSKEEREEGRQGSAAEAGWILASINALRRR